MLEYALRILFALNRQCEPDWKQLHHHVRHLKIVPDRLVERVNVVLTKSDPHQRIAATMLLTAERAGMLYIFGGLPGTGKSTLSLHLARELKAVHLRVDTIEQALREAGGHVTGPEGYNIAYRIAEDNLTLGLHVVADTVNPLQITRTAWREVATRAGAPFVEIEVVCSNETEHRARVETRAADIFGFRLPTWDEVVSRAYEPWDAEHILIDTAGQTPEQSIAALERALASR